jgi:hypothetical protein
MAKGNTRQGVTSTSPVPALEQRAEAISVEFNSKNVANTLWAYARMGTKPRERVMWQLEQRAASGGDIRGVQVAECCKHDVGVCDNWEKGKGVVIEKLERRAQAIFV